MRVQVALTSPDLILRQTEEHTATDGTRLMPALYQQVEIQFGGLTIHLRHDGTAFLPDSKTLLAADLHLGKESSFRAQLIPVPDGPTQRTLELLTHALSQTKPQRLIFLGDLIHDRNSMTSRLVESFEKWRGLHPELEVVLVRGNHDRHVKRFPKSWSLTDVPELQIASNDEVTNESVKLAHQAPEDQTHEFFIEGHWHPVARIGNGADQVRVRCFVQRQNRLTLPAFGPFKGGMLTGKRSATIYPLVEGYVLT